MWAVRFRVSAEKTQLPAYRKVAGDLRLSYSQFEELEKFARFSSQLDDDTRATLDRGIRAREILKQPRHELLDVPEQIVSMLALTTGLLDAVPIDEVAHAERAIHAKLRNELPELCLQISDGRRLTEDDIDRLRTVAGQAIPEMPEVT